MDNVDGDVDLAVVDERCDDKRHRVSPTTTLTELLSATAAVRPLRSRQNESRRGNCRIRLVLSLAPIMGNWNLTRIIGNRLNIQVASSRSRLRLPQTGRDWGSGKLPHLAYGRKWWRRRELNPRPK